ncbi:MULTISPECIES: sirohydrochlorin chelatase [unclassified Massilia]|uniref:sirohydrochlorin chelatase n=1 Tax=unclassified Massilia TaxID=2609279 RepID=UPI00177BF53C|nr:MULTISPECIES: CbiX/SirB N-terminal domain-containing protein [unclassified Massilia]MBD8531209.1 CbiX/SirB N-terminal domain-containing protein [Massilia sp. CFBP 13647]MBD8676528.1 CbiX/SirB N-terminal domain-containing protein [Massilia sp. CFBP 13721]
MKKALVLFAHGARAASWAAPFERLRDLTAARLPECAVRLAFLELMEPRLPQTVAEMVADGVDEVTIVPVFLGQGGHLLRDLPLLAQELRAAHPGLRLTVAGAVGEDPGVLAAMTDYCVRSVA